MFITLTSLAEDGISMIGDDVTSSVNIARSVGPGCYRIDGSEAHVISPNMSQDIICGPSRRVVWLLVIDLGNCLRGVSKGRPRGDRKSRE